MGAVAKTYMRKGFLIYEEMRKYLVIYKEAVSHDFASAFFWISLYMRKILLSFLSVHYWAPGTRGPRMQHVRYLVSSGKRDSETLNEFAEDR
jgi:hypothetical protein